MRFYWRHVWKSKRYQRATAVERRMIEIRFSLAKTIRQRRRDLRLTQKKLAKMVGGDQATISRLERATPVVALDFAFLVLLAMDATDEEIADAVNASARRDVWQLRFYMARRYATKPIPKFVQASRRSAASRIRPGRSFEASLGICRQPPARQ